MNGIKTAAPVTSVERKRRQRLFRACDKFQQQRTSKFKAAVLAHCRTVKAKFHYAIWFEAGSKLVADMVEAGRRRAPASWC